MLFTALIFRGRYSFLKRLVKKMFHLSCAREGLEQRKFPSFQCSTQAAILGFSWTHKRNVNTTFANYLNFFKNMLKYGCTGTWKCYTKFYKNFRANTWSTTLTWETLRKKPSRGIRKYRCLEKGVLKSLVKHSGPRQIHKMEHFAKIVNGLKPLTIFAKSSIIDVW